MVADGTSVFYRSSNNVGPVVYSRRADGSGAPREIAQGHHFYPFSTSPDGGAVLGRTLGKDTGWDLAVIDLTDGTAVTILGDPASESNPSLSPDGRWLAYASDESGRTEVFVRPYPELNGGRWQVSRGGGTTPMWRKDGRELFYRNEGKVLAIPIVPIETGNRFEYDPPTLLFEGSYTGSIVREYAVAPDGERFLVLKYSQDPTQGAQLVLVQNWFEELKQLVPTD